MILGSYPFSLVYSSIFGIKKIKDGQFSYLMTYPEPLALVLITSVLLCSFPADMLRIQSKAPLVEEN